MFFLLPLAAAAVGAVVGALVTHSATEQDRKAADYHRKVANDLTTKYSNLEKTYHEDIAANQKHVNDLTQQHASDETEKDLLRLAIKLQHSLYTLMIDIDKRPTHEALNDFKNAVAATNGILAALDEQPIEIPDKYFSRNLTRIKRRKEFA